MKPYIGLTMLLLFLLLSGLPAESQTATDLQFAIDGTTVKFTSGTSLDIGNGGNEYTLANGKKIKIVPVSTSGTPNFPEVYYDENLDLLVMRNAKITTSTPPIDNIKLSFWKQFNNLAAGLVNYSISGAGAVYHSTNGTPIDWKQSRAWVDGILLGSLVMPPAVPPNCVYLLTKCTTTAGPSVASFTSSNYNITQSINVTNATRELKSEFWIHLEKPNDYVQLSQSYGLRVKYGPAGGDRPRRGIAGRLEYIWRALFTDSEEETEAPTAPH